MSNELVINSTEKGGRIALLRDKRIVEYHIEESENQFTVGDIYLGTVRKISPGSNAAFVDIGHEKDAFLHYQDLGPNFSSLHKLTQDVIAKRINGTRLNGVQLEAEIDKFGKISQVLTKNAPILVQVVKEPISTKGPRLSCELSLAGRYIVLVPFSNSVNISKKITNKQERQRLARLLNSIKPQNFGIIVRTVAESKEVAELDRDLQNLMEKWENGMKLLREAKPREKIIGEMNRASSMLRDMLNESFDSITVDDKDAYEDIRTYIHTIAPEKEKIVKLYSGKNKIFEQFGIEKQLKSIFGRSVSLPGGGYLIIEHTEAMHVIDVNSGSRSNTEADQEATAVNTNIEAVKEIARQLRVRDMGGIISIDFIDMKKAENKRLIYEKMKEEMQSDRSKFTILPLTKFGVMQITRQRVRPELHISTGETCPTCGGTGKVGPTILLTDQIESNLEYIITRQNEKHIILTVHPYLHAYFTNGLPSRRMKWFFRYKTWIKIVKDSSLGITEYKFVNKFGDDIEIIP
ncbi:Rne/Rng family ribonuclease [Cytophagaceae bacterium DM2B3-1]|uniref:Rne/Rng family ribonuclease n=1 Tax=Xanthocytophaga flava TaxID=3048013 RepID=A0ABT7CPF7_9BACT|nr:Rne/Rng family ribonuclease [Xanthocytophaga flavus]MDJ1468769.1 Rne/Rng family ribonuclease [Xanthocytophaga flavus]MDJ1495629.1 Rne/Rng family ribonuclease [Xanthocytophaga flavus]